MKLRPVCAAFWIYMCSRTCQLWATCLTGLLLAVVTWIGQDVMDPDQHYAALNLPVGKHRREERHHLHHTPALIHAHTCSGARRVTVDMAQTAYDELQAELGGRIELECRVPGGDGST